jgi:hypothetical protein
MNTVRLTAAAQDVDGIEPGAQLVHESSTITFSALSNTIRGELNRRRR